MFGFDIPIRTCSIVEVKAGEFVMDGRGHFGFSVPAGKEAQAALLSIDERKIVRCVDDWGEPYPPFQTVVSFGENFLLRGMNKPKFIQDSQLSPLGALAVAGTVIYLVIQDGEARRRFGDLKGGKSVHPDNIQRPIAYFEKWCVVLPKVEPSIGETLFEFG